MQLELFTIGHSTHALDTFLGLLAKHEIGALADVRRFPGSKKYPHFNSDPLAGALQQAGVQYHWLESLGGRRGKQQTATQDNLGLRNESFRNYADYMCTSEFRSGIAELLDLAAGSRTAFMCSESLFWRCHRRLVSDFLLAKGSPVQHIMPNGELQPHTLTPGAKVKHDVVSYPSANADQARLFE